MLLLGIPMKSGSVDQKVFNLEVKMKCVGFSYVGMKKGGVCNGYCLTYDGKQIDFFQVDSSKGMKGFGTII